MPVRKFRSVEEMNQPVWREPGDPALYRTIAGIWDTGVRLHGRRFTPGVYRFPTIEALEEMADASRPSR